MDADTALCEALRGTRLADFELGERVGARRDGSGTFEGCNSFVFRAKLRRARVLPELCLKVLIELDGAATADDGRLEALLQGGFGAAAGARVSAAAAAPRAPPPPHAHVLRVLHAFRDDPLGALPGWAELRTELLAPTAPVLVTTFHPRSLSQVVAREHARLGGAPPLFSSCLLYTSPSPRD